MRQSFASCRACVYKAPKRTMVGAPPVMPTLATVAAVAGTCAAIHACHTPAHPCTANENEAMASHPCCPLCRVAFVLPSARKVFKCVCVGVLEILGSGARVFVAVCRTLPIFWFEADSVRKPV